jgi:hypothetical protein
VPQCFDTPQVNNDSLETQHTVAKVLFCLAQTSTVQKKPENKTLAGANQYSTEAQKQAVHSAGM